MLLGEVGYTSRIAQALWNRRHPEWAVDAAAGTMIQLTPSGLPRYALDRAVVQARRLAEAGPAPWITADARELLTQLLRGSDRGLEFGSGGTTSFFAGLVAHLHSVEAVEQWYTQLAQRLATSRITNVDLHLVSAKELGHGTEAHRRAYVDAVPDLPAESLDFVFVDGEYRDDCALRAVDLLTPGGLMILDNAEAYLPSTSRSPWSVPAPVTRGWQEFTERTASWRRVWTTNGVWDTAIWFKP
jgi:predicted O-methyltransferase YrrM